jgi:cytochrome P450
MYHVVDLLGGGTDTISATLSWNIAIMCNYPQVQRMASIEIDRFIKLNGRLPNFKERTQLPYCISVIKECMRFKPTTSFGIPHAVKNDGEYNSFHIAWSIDTII